MTSFSIPVVKDPIYSELQDHNIFETGIKNEKKKKSFIMNLKKYLSNPTAIISVMEEFGKELLSTKPILTSIVSFSRGNCVI